ncbi:excalibur calcium-binding domain-containing protein [Peribacillus sp. NPDC096379]|uniref:excalibur calcium-binding domain-containing protein n=1 Tax=Peribacillus sp. NPDC096379 TaxID=3364393 RepID=UPI0038078591
MKKMIVILLSLGLIFCISIGSFTVEAAVTKAKTYKNCTELNKDYSGGVAKSSTVKNKGGKTNYKPYVSKALYDANSSKDRDKDGIACER